MSRKLVICHLFPELLNLYGDGGNILTLAKRLEWRGIEADVREVPIAETPSFSDVDLVFIGGGSDREQRIVCERLLAQRSELRAYTEDGGGYGHGVGMSQNGAKALGGKGASCEEILRFFFGDCAVSDKAALDGI